MQTDFLDEIVKYKHTVVDKKRIFLDGIKRNVSIEPLHRYDLFKKNISTPGKIHLIAEIKKASPSKGLIRDDFDVTQLAKIYAEYGADAISVLTEDKYFLGNPVYVRKASENVGLPVLTKDFIIDELQIYETYTFGASAVLLIAAILEDTQIKHFINVAAHMDLACVVEVHDEEELDRAIAAGAEIIGVNNRDLHTFEVDLKVSEKLIPKIPHGVIAVSESGIKTHEDIIRLRDIGANAALIGEIFMSEDDIGKKITEVMEGI